MLELMRKHAKNWGMKFLLGIIIIVFIFYFGSLRDSDHAATIAIFDGKSISYAEFQREYQNLIDLYRNRLGDNFREELLKGLNLKGQAFDSLIRQAILIAKAEELKIRVSDEELRSSILSYPPFQRDGVFDQRVYEETLRLNKMTPDNFESMQRKMLITAKLNELITSGVHVSEGELFDLYRMQKERINVSYLKLSSKDFLNKVTPTAQALESYFKEHGNEFRVPEQVQVKYIIFSAADYLSSIKVTDVDIKDYYDRNKGRLAKPDKSIPALTEVSEKIASELRQSAAMNLASLEAKKAHDTIYQQENFDAYAAGKGLKTQTSAFFSADNVSQEFRTINDFSKNVLPLQKNEISNVMSNDKGYYLFQIASRKPAHIPDLKEVANEVENRYKLREAAILCKKEADSILERLKKGEDWLRLAKEEKLKVDETGFFIPGSGVVNLGVSEQLTDALAQISEARPYPDKVLQNSDNYLIIRYKEREKLDEKDFQSQKEELKKRFLEVKKTETIDTWIEGIKMSLTKEGRLKITKEIKDI